MALIQVFFGGDLEREVPLTKEVNIIGRQEDCDVHIDNLGVSRHHARIRHEGSSYVLEDLGSSNGTFVNGETVQQHTLNDQDKIAIGKFSLVFVATAGMSTVEVPQENQAAAGGAAGFGDSSLNTMAMDGNALRKRIEEMHSAKQAGGDPYSSSPQASTSADSLAEMRAREAEQAMMKASMFKVKLIIGVVVLVVVAIILAVALT